MWEFEVRVDLFMHRIDVMPVWTYIYTGLRFQWHYLFFTIFNGVLQKLTGLKFMKNFRGHIIPEVGLYTSISGNLRHYSLECLLWYNLHEHIYPSLIDWRSVIDDLGSCGETWSLMSYKSDLSHTLLSLPPSFYILRRESSF